MNSKIELSDWEKSDLWLDKDFTHKKKLFKYVDDVKIYMLKNNLDNNFLNKLWDASRISDNDYHFIIDWYYTRKTYIDTPEEREKERLMFEEWEADNKKKYQEILELLKNK